MKPSRWSFLDRKQTRILRVEVRDATRRPRGRRARPGGRRSPHPHGPHVASRMYFFRLYILLYPKNIRGARNYCSTAPTLMGPSWLPWPSSFIYIFSYTLKTSGEPWNHFSTAATFCTREIPSWGLFRRSAGGGFDHGGLIHQHHYLFDEAWVIYHRPSRSRVIS